MKDNIHSKKNLHLIYALKSGGGENIIKSFHKKGDLCISLTYNSCLEEIQYRYLPFRIKSKNRYYNFFEYIKSLPSLIILFTFLFFKGDNNNFIFHGFPFQYLTFLVSFNKKNNVYMVYHQFKKEPKTFKGLLSVYLERFFLKISSRTNLIGVSPWVINYIKKLFNPINKIFLLRVPIQTTTTNTTTTKRKRIIEENIDQFLIYGARLVQQKGQLRLLEDIHKMQISNPAIKTIIFCGSGNKKNEIINYAKILKHFDILVIDNLNHSDYLSLLKKSSGFLFPSFREAFPLSLLEAILLSKKTFIWEDYLYQFYKDCSYKSSFLELLLKGEKLPYLPNKQKKISELKNRYLKNENFLKSIDQYK